MRLPAILIALSLMAPWSVRAATASDPQHMLFVAYRYIGAGIEPDSFSGSERRVWRAGSHHLRLEEALDPISGLRLLMIVNTDDLWMINQSNLTGRHVREPKQAFQVTLPVFPGVSEPLLKALQIGDGAAFFAARHPAPLGRVVVGGVPCRGYELRIGAMRVQQYIRLDKGTPFQYTLTTPQRDLSVRYEHYQPDLPVNRFLFMPPQGVKIESVAPQVP